MELREILRFPLGMQTDYGMWVRHSKATHCWASIFAPTISGPSFITIMAAGGIAQSSLVLITRKFSFMNAMLFGIQLHVSLYLLINTLISEACGTFNTCGLDIISSE